jgi:ligand-binding sensor domain-containing protein
MVCRKEFGYRFCPQTVVLISYHSIKFNILSTCLCGYLLGPQAIIIRSTLHFSVLEIVTRNGSDNGLFLFHPDKGAYKHYAHIEKEPSSLGSNQVRTILADKKHHIWIGTVNGGLNLFDPGTGSFSRYQNEPENPSSLSQRTVSALFEDVQGNLWVGTHRGGINLYSPTRQKFGLHQQETGTNSISYNDVKCFFEDSQGIIWIGTDGGWAQQI